MAPHAKITVPGLAGLVLLVPALCLFYLNDTGVSSPKGALEMAMPYRDYDMADVDTLSGLVVPFYKPLQRNYRDIAITGSKTDVQQLKLGRQLMHSLMATNDTINGIRFCFGKDAKYNELVKTITLCNEEEVYLWMLKDKYLYIYNNYQPQEEVTDTIEYIYL